MDLKKEWKKSIDCQEPPITAPFGRYRSVAISLCKPSGIDNVMFTIFITFTINYLYYVLTHI